MLSAGAENTLALAGGSEPTRAEAIVAASGALVVAASDRGRQEYRLTAADTRVIVILGLTEQDRVDLLDSHQALRTVTTGR